MFGYGQFSFGAPSDVKSEAELVPQLSTVAQGETVYIYLKLTHPEGWYSYYYNNSVPTTIRPTLEIEPVEGVTFGSLQYPVPKSKESYEIPSYVYLGENYFRVPVTVLDGYQSERLTIKAEANWQICKESCLSESVELDLTLAVGESSSDLPFVSPSVFMDAEAPPIVARGSSSGVSLTVTAELPEAQFIDFDGQTALDKPVSVSVADGVTTMSLPSDAGNFMRDFPTKRQDSLRGYLISGEQTYWVDVPLEQGRAGGQPDSPTEVRSAKGGASGPDKASSPALQLPPAAELAKLYNADAPIQLPENSITIWVALLGAFLGGILLNLMPCVFPVLSLKVMSFVEHAGDDREKVKLHGLLFTLGVVISMLALVGGLFALKAATGESFNWGQQMSYPPVVAGIVIVLFLLGLNMAGVFELGTSLTALGNTKQSKNEYLSSMLSGVLTTVVATPCSGPFLGAAIGYAVSQHIVVAMIIFTVFAIGISFPYLFLSFFPQLTERLPRPGLWMETLKRGLSFGMFAAAAFFMQTFGAQTGGQGLAILVMALVIIGLAAFFYGHWTLPHLKKQVRYGLGFGLSLLVLVVGLNFAWNASTQYKAEIEEAQTTSKGVEWVTWQPGVVEYLRAQGKFVWVDYTASWCATCLFNKKVIFNDEEFLSTVDPERIVFVKADLTENDPVVAKDLSRANRVQIPVNIIYSPDIETQAVLLEEVIPVKSVLEGLEQVGYYE